VLTEGWEVDAASEWAFRSADEVVFGAECEGRRSLYTLDVAAAVDAEDARTPRRLGRGGWHGAPRPAGDGVFATVSGLDRPPEVVRYGPDGGEPARLTGFAEDGLDRSALGTVVEWSFDGHGGRSVQCWLVFPPGTAAEVARPPDGSALPLVHLVHGGPHGAFGDQWHWRWNAQLFAARGYLVALVNFHGSTGWGEDFTSSILGRWGDQPFADVMAATDRLVAMGVVDARRMAAAGGSYGGYLVAWIASQTDRFACLVNHAGVSDFQTQYASDVTQGRARSMGGEPWDQIEGMDRYNPLRHAAGFRSPMLVVHGERDYRVPHDQGLAIYGVYKAMGLPARLLSYPDENHWILKRDNSLQWYGEVLGWIDRWLDAGA
jgi:dipeptidyl aminopeptidase/acylaminoacyl peptidase